MTPRTIWHHRVHQEWAGEELAFWRLAFFPTYDYENIVKPLVQKVMSDLKIGSYAVYETMGVFDIFIRAWLPAGVSHRFERALVEALDGASLQLCEGFGVTRVVRHWVWDTGEGEPMAEPTRQTLVEPLPAKRIESVNLGHLGEDEFAALETASLLVRRQLVVKNGDDDESQEQGNGVKFLIVIASSTFATYQEREREASELVRIMQEREIEDASLYEGNGFGQFVMMGRVPADRFYLLPRLAIAVDSARRRDTARPYTFVSAHPGVMMFQEQLPTQLPPEPTDIRVSELLSQQPGATLAIVPSARMNWRRYLIGETPDLMPDEDHFNEAIVTTVVGLLNAQGGCLVVGALAADARFGPNHAEEHPLLAEYPPEGDYLVLGLDREEEPYVWDRFRQWLVSTIRLRVEPAPIGTVGVTKHTIHGRELCVIRVAPTSATWYYRRVSPSEDPAFFVREDARTVRQRGLSADIYKQASPRG
jgi:hypothetical protein